jgi:hypothetical protein
MSNGRRVVERYLATDGRRVSPFLDYSNSSPHRFSHSKVFLLERSFDDLLKVEKVLFCESQPNSLAAQPERQASVASAFVPRTPRNDLFKYVGDIDSSVLEFGAACRTKRDDVAGPIEPSGLRSGDKVQAFEIRRIVTFQESLVADLAVATILFKEELPYRIVLCLPYTAGDALKPLLT